MVEAHSQGCSRGRSDREIAFHIDELTAAHIASGMPPGEARRRAVLEFGGREQVAQNLREDCLFSPLDNQ